MLDTFKEYVKLIPKFLDNPENIVKGIINDVRFSHGGLEADKQEEIIRRRIICFSCPFNSTNAKTSEEYKKLNRGQTYKVTGRFDLHCAMCACNIHWKTAVLEENCGLNYYNDINPANKQELKWTEYKKPSENV